MGRVRVYVEGGGDSKEQHARCREGFSKLVAKAGFARRMPAFVACGGRGGAYDRFKTAVTTDTGDFYPMLLVDSEDPVAAETAWHHLKLRDGWDCPWSAEEDQAQMMVTCMETWIMVDREALRAVFGSKLRTGALLPEAGMEARPRDEVQESLEIATKDCGREKAYRKGRRSFQVLARLNPDTLRNRLPYFLRFLETLEKHLDGTV